MIHLETNCAAPVKAVKPSPPPSSTQSNALVVALRTAAAEAICARGCARAFDHVGSALMSLSMGDVSASGPFLTCLTNRTASMYKKSSLNACRRSSLWMELGRRTSWLTSCAEPQ